MWWSSLTFRYPALLLLVPYLAGYLAGPAAPVLWTLHAAFPRSPPPGQAETARRMMLGLVPMIMAAAGALEERAVPGRLPLPGRAVMVEGEVLEGPWPWTGFTPCRVFTLKPAHGADMDRIRVRLSGNPRAPLAPGDRVRFSATLHPVRGKPWAETREALVQRLRPRAAWSVFLRSVYRTRRRIRRCFEESMDREAAALACAFLLGLTDGVDPRLRAAFRETGTAHLLAISGLHVGLVTASVMLLLSAAGLKRGASFLVLLPVLLAFCLLSGRRPPVLRASLVCLLHLYAARSRRPVDPFLPLFDACLLLVLFHPAVVRSPSFQLSFTGYASLLLFLAFRRRFRTMFHPPASALRSHAPAARFARFLFGHLALAAGISTTSWLGTLPLVLYYFHAFNPWTPFANLVILPFFTIALLAGAGHGAAAVLGLHRSALTATPAVAALDLFASVLRALHRALPPPVVVRLPTPAAVAGIYLAAGLAVLLLHRASKRWKRSLESPKMFMARRLPGEKAGTIKGRARGRPQTHGSLSA